MPFSSVQSLSCVQLFVTPCTAAHQASLSITNSWTLLKLMSIRSMMPSHHLILCWPLLLQPSIFPSIRVFSWVSSLSQVAKVLAYQLQYQSFQWLFLYNPNILNQLFSGYFSQVEWLEFPIFCLSFFSKFVSIVEVNFKFSQIQFQSWCFFLKVL